MEVLDRGLAKAARDVREHAAPGESALIRAVRELADGPLAELADDIDRRGIYPKSILHRLGELGALKAHMAEGDKPADYGLAIQAITEVSRVCGATGFMVWCHEVCGVYMEQSGNPALMGEMLDKHSRGETLGATGMSNPMKTFAGIEAFLLHARRVEDGWRVNGTLPWVSNLGPDHYLGAVADVESADDTKTEIMFLVHCGAPGVELRSRPSFSAMEGTNTWAVRLTDYFVGAKDLIANPVQPLFCCKPAWVWAWHKGRLTRCGKSNASSAMSMNFWMTGRMICKANSTN